MQATRSVLLSTFVIYEGRAVFAELIARLRELPTLAVEFYVHPEHEKGTVERQRVAAYLKRFREEHWPADLPLPAHQFASREEGAISSAGWLWESRFLSRSSASTCTVLPSPMSSARYLVKQRQKADALARAEFTRQLPLANRLLASLGFNPVPHREEGRACKEDYLCFRPSGLSVFLGDRGIYLYNGDKLITQAEHAGATHGFSAASYLPRLNAVISSWSRRDGPTDCHPQQGVELTPIDSKKK